MFPSRKILGLGRERPATEPLCHFRRRFSRLPIHSDEEIGELVSARSRSEKDQIYSNPDYPVFPINKKNRGILLNEVLWTLWSFGGRWWDSFEAKTHNFKGSAHWYNLYAIQVSALKLDRGVWLSSNIYSIFIESKRFPHIFEKLSAPM
jgi:hypothetical protein